MKKQSKLILILSISTGVAICVLAFVATSESRQYALAVKKYQAKQFNETLHLINSLSPKYRSKAKVTHLKSEVWLQIAKTKVDDSDYDKALYYLKKIPTDFYRFDEVHNLIEIASLAIDRQKEEREKERERIRHAYRVISTKNHSYRTTDGTFISHKDYRVVVPVETINNHLRLMAETITSLESTNINSVRIWFFWPDSDTTGAYSAGMATCARYTKRWGIKMEFGKTYSEATPQYSNKTENLTLAKRKKIFWDLVVEEDRAGIAGDTEQCKIIIAKRYGISASEVSKIQVEAVNKMWPMPEDPLY